MTFLEKELEDLLFDMIKDPLRLWREKRFHALGELEWRRQVNLRKYGIADIVGVKIESSEEHKKTKVTIHVIELKKDIVNYQTLGQACRYLSAITREAYERLDRTHEIKIQSTISLVGTSVDESSDFCFMSEICDNLRVYKAIFDPYKGLIFEPKRDYYFEDSKTNCLQGVEPIDFLDISLFDE